MQPPPGYQWLQLGAGAPQPSVFSPRRRAVVVQALPHGSQPVLRAQGSVLPLPGGSSLPVQSGPLPVLSGSLPVPGGSLPSQCPSQVASQASSPVVLSRKSRLDGDPLLRNTPRLSVASFTPTALVQKFESTKLQKGSIGQGAAPQASGAPACVGQNSPHHQLGASHGSHVSHASHASQPPRTLTKVARAISCDTLGAKTLDAPSKATGPQRSFSCRSSWRPKDEGDDQRERPARQMFSANVKVSATGEMQLQVRIKPQELLQWRELQIISCIDEASFGEVLLARRGSDVVCVKRCRNGNDGSMTKEQLQNFEREINAYRMLRHPGITSYLGCILEHPNLAVVLEHMPNGNVFDLLYMNGVNVRAESRLQMASQVTDAVSYMHSADPILAHLDIKTPNILMDENFNAKLCDFGKSRVISPHGSFVEGQELLGSPRYMAPELFGGAGAPFSEKADIWGLSCCLVEILGGPIPYEELPDVEDIMSAHVRQTPPLVPPWFAFVARLALERCFDFVPERRLKASELLRTLQLLSPRELELHGMDKRRTK